MHQNSESSSASLFLVLPGSVRSGRWRGDMSTGVFIGSQRSETCPVSACLCFGKDKSQFIIILSTNSLINTFLQSYLQPLQELRTGQ